MSALSKPTLFQSRKEYLIFFGVIGVLLLLRLGWAYSHYRDFITKPFYFTYATVERAYVKHKAHRSYQVIKARSDEGLYFYTTTHYRKDLSHTRIRLQLFPDASLSFWNYLGTGYIKSRIKNVEKLPFSAREELASRVSAQHKDKELASFYNALFFATPISPALREKVSALGVSHLVALSGFHLGILWGLVYGLGLLLYRPLQQRYFPYRYALHDVGTVAIVLLGIYVWFTGAPPSLVRAYAMVFLGWLLLLMGLELLSFSFLAVIAVLLLLLMPSLLVSVGFWLSMAGVFYIFLLLKYSTQLSKQHIMLWVIPLGIFLLMLPVVHLLFPVTSPWQLLSPILSLLFVPFYPLVMGLHLIGMGDLIDPWLTALFALPTTPTTSLLPWWAGTLYGVLSLAAIRYRTEFMILMIVAAGYAGYLFA